MKKQISVYMKLGFSEAQFLVFLFFFSQFLQFIEGEGSVVIYSFQLGADENSKKARKWCKGLVVFN